MNENPFPITIKDEDIRMTMVLQSDPTKPDRARVILQLGPIEIRGIRVMRSKFQTDPDKELTVTPPGIKINPRVFYYQVWIENEKLWDYLKNKILDKYKELRIEHDLLPQDGKIVEPQ